MPPRNNPVPNAVRLFNCTICDKGYPRQLDYENHLGSYDHNHRQRLADMKKLTASNDSEGMKPKQGPDMRSINIEDANKMPGIGSRFTKIGGGVVAGGSRFKKVGVTVGMEGEKKEANVVTKSVEHADDDIVESIEIDTGASVQPVEEAKEDDVVMKDEDEDEVITWEEYDFTKPTGCDDHDNCPGCKTDGIWSGQWLEIDSA